MPDQPSEEPRKVVAPPPKRHDPAKFGLQAPGPRQEELDEREERLRERPRKPMGPQPDPEERQALRPEEERPVPDVPPTSPEPA
jgi:hypothetical protein